MKYTGKAHPNGQGRIARKLHGPNEKTLYGTHKLTS
jgi:hypothetical protein